MNETKNRESIVRMKKELTQQCNEKKKKKIQSIMKTNCPIKQWRKWKKISKFKIEVLPGTRCLVTGDAGIWPNTIP